MLGDLIYEAQGQVMGTRVLPSGGGPVVEVSFQGTGQLLETAVTEMGTYESVMRADGTLFGDGQGVVMTADGQSVSWHGQGVGKFTGGGAVSWRGAVYYEAASDEFTRLNTVAAVFEYEVDEGGKTTAKIYEWK